MRLYAHLHPILAVHIGGNPSGQHTDRTCNFYMECGLALTPKLMNEFVGMNQNLEPQHHVA